MRCFAAHYALPRVGKLILASKDSTKARLEGVEEVIAFPLRSSSFPAPPSTVHILLSFLLLTPNSPFLPFSLISLAPGDTGFHGSRCPRRPPGRDKPGPNHNDENVWHPFASVDSKDAQRSHSLFRELCSQIGACAEGTMRLLCSISGAASLNRS